MNTGRRTLLDHRDGLKCKLCWIGSPPQTILKNKRIMANKPGSLNNLKINSPKHKASQNVTLSYSPSQLN